MSETLGAAPLTTSPVADFDWNFLSKEEKACLWHFIREAFGHREIRHDLLDRIVTAHPDFQWNSTNVDHLVKIVKRRDWKKNIVNEDDFAYWWSSNGEKSFYAQVMRVAVTLPEPTPEEEKGFDIEPDKTEPAPKPVYNTAKLTSEEIELFRLRMPKQEDRDQVTERNKSAVWKPHMVSAAMHLVLERVGDGETIGFEDFANLMDMVNADFKEQAAQAF